MNTSPVPTPDKLAEGLSGYALLQNVPREQLLWLASHGEVRTLQAGEMLFQKDDPLDFLFIILAGKIQFKLEQKGEYRILNELVEGDISGALPYSRAKNAMTLGEARGETTVLQLTKAHFTEMINHHHELTEALVHVMTTRVRDFTREEQQTEKLAALGRLSAGLHHELNNPAAAAQRAAKDLSKQLALTPEKFKPLMLLQLSPEQVDQINTILFETLKKKPAGKLGMMERSSLEESIVTWLTDHGVEDAYEQAETFAQHHFDVEALESLEAISGPDEAGAIAGWIYNVLATEKLVKEIQESTKRISQLVGAVKTYAHMDGSPERERTDLVESIQSTLSMLNFKIKKKKVQVAVEAPEELPQACVFIGELNQVWTNLIDNALDAMEEEGRLSIKLTQDEGNIRISLTDSGSGIPEDVKQRIFDPFFTTKAIGQGSGMGLDISKKIVEQHGGTIEVDSKPGETTFTITIPENPVT